MRDYCNLLYADKIFPNVQQDELNLITAEFQKIKCILLSLTWYKYEY